MNVFDEGFTVYGTLRIMNGDVPYRDFWMIYPPGQFYTLALLFRLFGATVLVERIWDLMLRTAVTGTIYVLATQFTSPTIALLPWFVVTLRFAQTEFYGYAAIPALLFVLLGALCLFNFFAQRRPLWVFVGGLLVGISILFRHDLGNYALICNISVLAVFACVHREDGKLDPTHRVLSTTRSMLALLVGVSVPVLPMLLYLVNVVPIHELWSDLVVNPIALSSKFYFLPLPALLPYPLPAITGNSAALSYARYILHEWIPFYLPFLIFGLTIFALHKDNRLETSSRWGIMLLTLLGLAFSIQAIRRADSVHLLPMFILAVIVSTFLSVILLNTLGSTRAILLIAILIPITAKYTIFDPVRIVRTYSPLKCFSGLERSGCIIVDADQERAIQFVQTRVPRDEPIFVGNSRHDRIFANDIMFYFLADRHSATKYHQLERSLVTTLPIQQEIVESLKSRRVRYVIVVSLWENEMEQNDSGVSSGVTLLDDFIRGNYQQVAQFGSYAIYKLL